MERWERKIEDCLDEVLLVFDPEGPWHDDPRREPLRRILKRYV